MSYLSPSTAPTVHIELLPATAKAVDVYMDTTDTIPSVNITKWASGPDIHVKYTSENTYDEFVEYTCCDCEYYTEEMEHRADGEEVNGLELTGTYYTYSPCPAYHDGIREVSFPCDAGNDEPEGGDDDDVSAQHIRYTISYQPTFDTCDISDGTIFIQACRIDDDNNVYVSDKYSSINCYENGDICWGNLTAPTNLADMLVLYTSSPGNEDLTTIDAHADGHFNANCNQDELRPTAVPCSTYSHRGKAVAVASAMWNTAAYMLLAASGCPVNKDVAFVPVSLYQNVAIDDDTILNVFATDVLSSGTRLLFYHSAPNDDSYNGQFIGQVSSTFSLKSCTSQPPQSSEQAELVSF